MKGICCETLKTLFGQGIEDLREDNFEGSVDEYDIFKEVFFRNDGEENNRCMGTGTIDFENNQNKDETSFCSNSDNSVMTGFDNLQNEEDDSGPLGNSEELINMSDVQVKRIKFLAEELSICQPHSEKLVRLNASKGTVSGLDQPAFTTCRLVESSGQGITSRCYLLAGHEGEMSDSSNKKAAVAHKGHVDDMGDKGISQCNLSSLNGADAKEAYVLSKEHADDMGDKDTSNCTSSILNEINEKTSNVGKAVDSLVSQESHASKLLVGTGKSVGCHKPKWKEHSFVDLDEHELSAPKNPTNDPKPLLRFHIFCLFRAAGWRVGRRRRSKSFERTGEFVYKTPEGRPIREFRRAWVMCGQRLFVLANDIDFLRDCYYVKKWDDISQFRSDLDTIMIKVEEQFKTLEVGIALACWWYQLDPLAKAVFVDRKIGSLRLGKPVNPKRSSIPCLRSRKNVLRWKNDIGQNINPENLITNSGNTSCQTGPSLYEVPLHNDNSYTSPGGSDSVWSGYVHKDGGQPIDAKEGRLDEASSPKDVLNRKASKKEKRISEMKFPMGYKDYNSGLSVGYKSDPHHVGQGSIALNNVTSSCFVTDLKSEDSCKWSPLCSSEFRNDHNSKRVEEAQLHSGTWKKLAPKKKGKRKAKWLSVKNSMDRYPPQVKRRKYQKQSGISDMKSKKQTCDIEDDDLLVSAIIKNKSSTSSRKPRLKKKFQKLKALRKWKGQKGSCRLLPRSFGLWSGLGVRTVLSWLISSGVIHLNEVIQYRNPKDDTVVKDGFITGDGIICRCCDKLHSVSEFKSHAGFQLKRPCLNLFMESGKSFILCQLEAWSAEYKLRINVTRSAQVDKVDQNDDSCRLCGDGGELICCDNCPSTFHQACLYAKDLPEGNWYCSQCSCWACGDVVNDSSDSLKCSQCEHKYHEDCIKEKGSQRGAVPPIRFCGESCKEVHSGLKSQIGHMNSISDGFSWALLKCIHGDQKVHSAQRLVALKAECNSKLAVALTIMEECFLPMVDPRTGINMIPHVVYNCGSEFMRLSYEGFHTVILEKDDVLMSVASLRIHGVTIAEMPLIATCSKYRRQGNCRRLVKAIEEMLKSLKVEKLVVSAIPSLVETWTEGFGFTALEDHEKHVLAKVNLMVFPGTVWLKKTLFDNHGPVKETKNRTEMVDYLEQCPLAEPCHEKAVSLEDTVLVDGQDLHVCRGQDSNLAGDFPAEPSHQGIKNSCLDETAFLEDALLVDGQDLRICNEQDGSPARGFPNLQCEKSPSNSDGRQLEENSDDPLETIFLTKFDFNLLNTVPCNI